MMRVKWLTYGLLLINICVFILALLVFIQGQLNGNQTTSTKASNAFAWIGMIDLVFCLLITLRSNWWQNKVLKQTMYENTHDHIIIGVTCVIAFLFHGMFMMTIGYTSFNVITDKPTSGLAAWCTIIFMGILMAFPELRVWYVHIPLLIPFFLFAFLHTLATIMTIPFILLVLGFSFFQTSTYQGHRIGVIITDLLVHIMIGTMEPLPLFPLGSYFTICFPELNRWKKRNVYLVPNYIIPARCQPSQLKQTQVTKDQGRDIERRKNKYHIFVQPVLNGVWSNQVYQYEQDYQLDKLDLTECIEQRKNTQQKWTPDEKQAVKEIHQRIKIYETSTCPVRLTGPFGGFCSLQYESLIRYRYVLLVGDQLGAIPLTCYFNQLLHEYDSICSKHQLIFPLHIYFYWSCPERTVTSEQYHKSGANVYDIAYSQFQPNFLDIDLVQQLMQYTSSIEVPGPGPSLVGDEEEKEIDLNDAQQEIRQRHTKQNKQQRHRPLFTVSCVFNLLDIHTFHCASYMTDLPKESQLSENHPVRKPNFVSIKTKGYDIGDVVKSLHQTARTAQQKSTVLILPPADNENNEENDAKQVSSMDSQSQQNENAIAVLHCGLDVSESLCRQACSTFNDLSLPIHYQALPFNCVPQFDQ